MIKYMERRNVWWIGSPQVRQIVTGVFLYAVIGWLMAHLPQLGIGEYELSWAMAIVPLSGFLGGPVIGFCVGALGYALLGIVIGDPGWLLALASGTVGFAAGIKYTDWGHHLPTPTDAVVNGVIALVSVIVGLVVYVILMLLAGRESHTVAKNFWQLLVAWGLPAAVLSPAFLQLWCWWRYG